MNFTFTASINCHLEFSKKEFEYLFDKFVDNTDLSYESEIGGFMYGFKNQFKNDNAELCFSIIQIDKSLKVLEGFNDELGDYLKERFDLILTNAKALKKSINESIETKAL